ncbi:MAG: hypothetical protein JEZ03_01965 [Bacteroidales bacterium]|nr:hypothetical protein [Bacteroidales bacterium]
MEDLLTYNFQVKSSVHDYEVEFTEDFSVALSKELRNGDVIIIDQKILELYPARFDGIVSAFSYITIVAEENQKSYLGIVPVIEKLIERNFRRNNRLIAIGGGITQDIAAFISSVLYRGLDWIFFPTTLLAQADSCIGGKTSINFGDYKNQIGNFYPPQKIFIDSTFIQTLSKSHIWSGLGEMLHYYIVSSKDDFIRFSNEFKLAVDDQRILLGLIARSLEIKKHIIEIDEFDKKERLVFNYGHSFGHAIESLTNFRIPHGIAVSFGMDIANFISVKKGYLKDEVRQEMRKVLKEIWKDYSIKDLSIEGFKSALRKDKKNTGKDLRVILNKGYGYVFLESMQMDDFLEDLFMDYFTSETD